MGYHAAVQPTTPSRSSRSLLILAILGLLGLVIASLAWWSDNPTPPREANPEAGRAAIPQRADEANASPEEETRSEAGPGGNLGAIPDTTTETATTGSVRVTVVHGPKDSAEQDRVPTPGVVVILENFTDKAQPERRLPTDAQGRSTFADLPPGRYMVRVDRQTMVYRVAQVLAGKAIEVTVPIQTGAHVAGVVVDKTGTPVPDAQVLVSGWAGESSSVLTTTGPRGRFEARHVGSLHSVGAMCPGYTPSPMQVCAAGDGASIEVRIVLPGPGGSLAGTVLDVDGKPVTDVKVRYGNTDRGSVITLPDGSRGSPAKNAFTRTDQDGRFLLEGLPLGTRPLLVHSTEHPSWKRDVEITAHQRQTVQVQLGPPALIEGTVRDAAGKPVAKAQVSVKAGPDQPVPRNGRTDGEGRYRIGGLSPGAVEIEAVEEQLGRTKATLRATAGRTLDWSPTLDPGHVIVGVILGKGRQPLKQAFIEAMATTGPGSPPWWSFSETDEGGAFRLLNCPAGQDIELEIQSQGYTRIKRTITLADSPLRVQMEWIGKPTGRIRGRVLKPDGQPVASAELTLLRKNGPGGFVYTTNAKGEIDIPKQHGGTYQLLVKSAHFPRSRTPWRPLAKNGVLDFGDLQLELGGRVLVTLESDAPIPKTGVYLSLVDEKGNFASRVDRGKTPALSDPVAPGPLRVRLSGPKIVPASIPVTVTAGQNTPVKIAVRTGVVQRVVHISVAGEASNLLDLTIRGPGIPGSYEQRLRHAPKKPFVHAFGCLPGTYKLTARCGTRTAEFAFTVTRAAATPDARPVTIPFTMR